MQTSGFSRIIQPSTPRGASSRPMVEETPRHAKGDVGRACQDKIRVDVAEQMAHELLECSITDFLSHYAPFIPSNASVKSSIRALRDGPEPLLSGNNKWRDFDSEEMSGKEKEVFAELAPIVELLAEQHCTERGGRARSCAFDYISCGDTLCKGEITGCTFRVDGCLMTQSRDATSKAIKPSEMAVVAEFKVDSKPSTVYDNRLKVVGAANHVMNDDPRRMWMYGITIEHEQMSVWYFSRSHSVKSKSFDFTKDPRTFIEVFMSLLFATEAEMGFDPTVRRVLHKKKIHYIYTITSDDGNKRYFRTISPIYNPRTACISGRKTRVWKAEEVDASSDEAKAIGDTEVALKDVWLDEGSRTEKEILDLIEKRLELQKGVKHWPGSYLGECIDEAFENFPSKLPFMKIDCDGRGERCKERLATASPEPTILEQPHILQTPQQAARHTVSGSIQNEPLAPSTSSGHSRPAPSHPNHPIRTYVSKRQYRLVYHRVGFALSEARDLKTVFTVIRDIVVALTLLFLAGFVHRDISTGNIIVIQDGTGDSRGLLSDFEYAKELNSNERAASYDPKTGTPFFMPLEIHLGWSLATQTVTVDTQKLRQIFNTYRPGRAVPQASHPQPTNCTAKFRHNHDLESLMWIALWFLLCRVKVDSQTQPVTENRSTLGAAIFTNAMEPSSYRLALFKNPGHSEFKTAFHPDLGDDFHNTFHTLHALLLDFCSKSLPTQADFEELFTDIWVAFGAVIDAVQKAPSIELEKPASGSQSQESSGGDDSDHDDKYEEPDDKTKQGNPRKRKAPAPSHVRMGKRQLLRN